VTPLSNHGIGYAASALFDRANELYRLGSMAKWAVIGLGLMSVTDHRAMVLAARLEELAIEMSETADALHRAGAAVAPAEALRERVVREGAMLPLAAVLGGVPWVWRHIESGSAWTVVRSLATVALDGKEWEQRQPHSVEIVLRHGGSVPPPQSLEDRVRRIPSGDTHIRIERFSDRVELYLSGTNFVGGASDPWNAVSNLELARTGSAASLIAARESLQAAGVTSTTPLVITGHSQGGLVALALAQSGHYRVDALITLGTPAGIIGDTRGVPTLHLIHPADPVPPLGGAISPTSTTWIVEPQERAALFDAHHNASYVPTARRVDEMDDPAVDRMLARFDSSGLGLRSDAKATSLSTQP
jgi:hypothetical protein